MSINLYLCIVVKQLNKLNQYETIANINKRYDNSKITKR